MAITVTADLDGPAHRMSVSMMSRRSHAMRVSPRRSRRPSAISAHLAKRPSTRTMRMSAPAPLPGVIGAAVVRAARHSARLSRIGLARRLNVSIATVRGWESGILPLFSVPYGQLQQLAQALADAGAQLGTELGELLLASRCDLLLTGMLNDFEDFAEVPPINGDGAEAESARSLLRWALAGQAPDLYSRYASPHRLLGQKHADRLVAIADDLHAGSRGADLVDFGGILVALAGH
jgi:DNA-binding transcriptional regulator YiaG